jgi:subtilisin-like proprotein convertase family protein
MAQSFNGTGTGPIPDATVTGTFGAPLNVSFVVSGIGGSLSNISLSTTLTHTWIGDLEVVLAPPGVTPGNAGSFVIYSRVGATDAGAVGDSSNLGGTYVFANSAANNIWTVANGLGDNDVIPAGSYRTVVAAPSAIPAPVTDFTAAFSGLTPAQINGTWTLRFRDRGQADIGSVSAAALTLTAAAGATNTLNVARNGGGTGTVTSNPAGINCGATCSFAFTAGIGVALSAVADAGSTFVSWGGDCSGSGACNVSMTQARNVSATFNSSGGGGGLTGTWFDLGPGPAHDGQIEGITNRPVSGAVNAVAPHPTDATILYAGAVNGGIWRTANATAAVPTWTRQTDTATSQSITSLRFDPTDATRLTLLAGIGRNSSIGGDGGALTGLLRTSNGGSAWTALNGGGTLNNKDIRAVAPRGAVLLVAATDGLYRSTDTGASFALVSGAGGSGLPSGNPTDLVGDPGNNSLMYTVMFNSATPGIYRSTNTGSTWTKVSDAPTDALIANGVRGMLAVGQSSNVFLAVVGGNGRLAAIVRSANGTSGWTDLGFPTTAEEGGALFGVHPGGQGEIHLSLAADPTDSNIVYIGGDRQPYFSEAAPGSGVFFPNSLGANDYSGRLFRGNASQPPATRWTSLTHSGAGNNSSPHADSRAMAFDAAGNLIESDDGGVYKRNTPRTTTGAWVSLVGDLQVTEYHGIAYDGIADRVIGGAQDTGTTQQQQAASRTFISVHTGDGGDPVVDDISSATISSRYSSFQNLQVFRRRTYNAADVFQSQTFPALTPIGGSPAINPQFYTPLAVNRANGQRLLIGAFNGVYESLDQGATVTRIATQVVNSSSGDALEYGVPGNSAFIYLASGNNLYLRTAGSGAPTLVNTIGALTLRDVAVDPAQPTRLFALSSSAVSFSSNSGATYANVTGNLGTLSPGNLRSMVYVPRPSGDILVVGADRGTFYALSSGGFSTWQALGTGLPRVPVYELAYHATRDALIAGTLGRGAWRLNGVATGGGGGDSIFRNGFE